MTILVTFASRHGGTRGIAETIAAELETHGHDTTFAEVSRAGSLDACDGVVLGSGVYLGRWLPRARAFIEANQSELSARPVWLFSSGPLGQQPREAPADIAGFSLVTNMIDHALFGGRLDNGTLGIGERLLTRVVGAPEGDYRDWDEIRAWAALVASQASLLQTRGRKRGAATRAAAGPLLAD